MIPDFVSTQQAQAFGREHPELREELGKLRAFYLAKAEQEKRAEDERVYATILKAQFCREAIEAIPNFSERKNA
jgi:hypothetical protein